MPSQECTTGCSGGECECQDRECQLEAEKLCKEKFGGEQFWEEKFGIVREIWRRAILIGEVKR